MRSLPSRTLPRSSRTRSPPSCALPRTSRPAPAPAPALAPATFPCAAGCGAPTGATLSARHISRVLARAHVPAVGGHAVTKAVTVDPQELLARFVQHVLSRRFVKIRHDGLHSASHATTRLETARQRLGPDAPPAPRPERPADGAELLLRLTGIDLRLCPACHLPTLVRVALPDPRARAPPRAA